MLLLKNARLIPYLTEGYCQGLADIVVENGRIQSIVPAGNGSVPSDGDVLDVNGKTVMPGMFDLHMHLYFSSSNFAAVALRSQNDYVFDSISYAKEFLRQGFTTIRDCGNVCYIGIAVRDAAAAGIIEAPRILTAGKCITPYAKGNSTFPNLYWEVNTPEEILAACRYEYAQGVDFFKYMGTGSVANLTGVPGELVCSREELFALQAAADAMHTTAAVHCHGKEGILYCAQAGIHTIEHASMIDNECIEEILRQNGKTTIVPTLNPVINIHRCEGEGAMPKIIRDKIDLVYSQTHLLVEATRAGVLTGWGTDTSMGFFKAHPGYEFDARREIGYTNEEMLKQDTINSAKILGMENDLGTVKEGKMADLIVINGNPDEDITAMYALPDVVLKEGKRCF